MSQAPAATRRSSFLGAKLTLEQPIKGYRAAIDPALLAASLCVKPDGLVVEFGCGAGAALLSAAVLNPHARFIGIEQDNLAAQLARTNAQANNLVDRVHVITGDGLCWRGETAVDAVMFNPPFFDDPDSLRSPSPEREASWINDSSLADWIGAGLKRLREGGRITLIQRADRLGDILTALAPKAGGVRVLPVHPRASEPAKRVIVSAIKTSKAPLQLLTPLVLHEAGSGAYISQTDAILRGEARTALAEA